MTQGGPLGRRRCRSKGRGKSSVASGESELVTLIRCLAPPPLSPPSTPTHLALTRRQSYVLKPSQFVVNIKHLILCAMGRMIDINTYRFKYLREFNELIEKLLAKALPHMHV